MAVTTPFEPATRKLYVVTRRDLTPGLQMAQSIHAAIEFGFIYQVEFRSWHSQSNHVCVLAVDNEADLRYLYRKAHYLGIGATMWCEPDLAYETTAIAIDATEAARDMLSGLSLAGRETRLQRWIRKIGL